MRRGSGTLFGAAISIAGLFGVAGTVTWWNAWFAQQVRDRLIPGIW